MNKSSLEKKINEEYSSPLISIIVQSFLQKCKEKKERTNIDFKRLKKEKYSFFSNDTIEKLITKIIKEKELNLIKEYMLKTVQIYFDGLIERPVPKDDTNPWKRQSKTLSALLEETTTILADFYRTDKKNNLETTKKIIQSHKDILIEYSLQRSSKDRHLERKEYAIGKYISQIIPIVKKEEIESIIPITSGGFEPALLIESYLQTRQIVPIRYSVYNKADKEPKIPLFAPKDYAKSKITNKNILVVDDMIGQGTTFETMAPWIKKLQPKKALFTITQETNRDFSKVNLKPYQELLNTFILE